MDHDEPGSVSATKTEEDPAGDGGSVRAGGVFAWDAGRLAVTDPQVLSARLDRDSLSPSAAQSLGGCPARWAAERVLPRASDPFGPAELGTAAHTVLERLYQAPPGDRDAFTAMSVLLDMAERRFPGTGAQAHARRGLWVAEVHAAYQGLFTIERPSGVRVAATERRLSGLEVAGVPFTGIVDRLDDKADGTVRLVDYKTGRAPSKHKRERFGDEAADQLRLYAEAIRAADGSAPGEALLYYTRDGSKRKVGTGRRPMRATLDRFAQAWQDLGGYVADGAFPTRPSPLCGWCPLVAACPAAQSAGYTARVHGAPSETDLGIPVVREVQRVGTTGPDAAHLADEQPHRHTEGTGAMTTLVEGKPWEETLDGALNPNSYAAMGVVGIAELAYETLQDAGIALTKESIDALAGTFAVVVTTAQHAVTGSTSFQDGANTRMRGALRTVLASHPFPFDRPAGEVDAWVHTATKHCRSIVLTGVRLYDNGVGEDQPWTVFAAADDPGEDGESGDDFDEVA